MTKSDDNAYPLAYLDMATHEHGLTKREYFAACALQGLLSNPSFTATHPREIAEKATIAADLQIESLNG